MKTCQKGLHQYETGKRCLECVKAYNAANRERQKAWRAAHKDSLRAYNIAWKVEHPGWKAAWKTANPGYDAMWRSEHKDSVKVSNATWRAQNSEYVKSYSAARYAANPGYTAVWRAKNPEADSDIRHRRRARQASNAGNEPVTKAHLLLLLEAQDGCCRYCRTPLGKDKHLDHRIPISRGGPHAPSNVCWSCPKCNLRKHTRTEAEFMVYLT